MLDVHAGGAALEVQRNPPFVSQASLGSVFWSFLHVIVCFLRRELKGSHAPFISVREHEYDSCWRPP